jgi:hypothetical protein
LAEPLNNLPRGTVRHKIHPALDKSFPLLEGAIHHTYEYEGWKIRTAFIEPDGRSVRMDYSKSFKAGVSPTIQDYKGLSKLFESYFGEALGQKMWQRSDGAILRLRSKMIVCLELPAAQEYEAKIKAEKEQKARASVPKF